MDSQARVQVQAQIRNLFQNKPAHGHGISRSFRDFHPASGIELQKMMLKLVQASQAAAVAVRSLVLQPSEAEKQSLEAAIEVAEAAIKDRVNPHLVKMAMGIFLTHSKEAQYLGVVAPSLKEHLEFAMPAIIPIEKTVIPEVTPTIPSTFPELNPTTADTLKAIETLSYWREDYDLNDHHYHWHLVYPWSGISTIKEEKIHRTIDRQGELFLYMHSQMLARYNAERLSWSDIGLVDPWSYDEVVEPSYTPPPGLRDEYGARPPLQGWLEEHSPFMPEKLATVSKDTMIFWRNNINKGIIQGYFYTKKENGDQGKFNLTEDNAMNWVGIIVEAEAHQLQEVSPGSNEFIDSDLYGTLHNLGHDKFGEIGYQTYMSNKNRWGVMGFTSVAVRDPVFWIWHRHIDDFRQSIVKKYKQHALKESAPPHVKLTGVQILPQDENSTTPDGGIATYLTAPQLGLHEVNAKLNHEPYKWVVKVEATVDENEIKNLKPFTVRIFIAPKQLMHEQRRYIEMDKFLCTLTTKSATFVRLDVESSVARKVPDPSEYQDPRCLCGWPQNMMIPNGTELGIDYVVFAILTNDIISEDDTVSMSFCGAKDNKYPDPRGMGYPFDKAWFRTSSEMREAIKGLDHVKLSEFKIYRKTQLYQGRIVTVEGDISWENTIQYFFTQNDASYMMKEYKIDLTKKKDVIRYRMFIFGLVEDGTVPVDGNTNEKKSKWSDDKITKFEAWIDADFP
ncbi:PREDICTED: tyrosinase family protein asqI-like [Amphimedon queenslandica]|uniref:Tyrosinase copper-binding domain-containing protein n=1 Tax=Amphimedon queenslandica TaxID=400682 RepID=A0AAN0JP80_AMPQE|nr:PREDICTED: tyrosinase family protein asqI-like [Amphimedon queenslandica]|eukprot:XP_019858840.1 PREDICTED: tyrosinase family protein asqI-like [Amphimedon queenslandica]